MKFKSALITQGSGSIGGITFATGIGGMFMRARAIPVNPNTEAQNAVRSALGALTSFWNTITTPQRNGWNAYAAQVPLPDTFGDPRLVSGFNHFIRSNTPRLRALGSSEIISDAPSIFNIGSTPVLVAVSSTINTPDVLVSSLEIDIIDAPDPADVKSFIFVYVSPPFNQNRTFHRGPFLLDDTHNVDVTASQPQTMLGGSTFGWTFAGNQGVQYRIYQSQGDGRLSGALFVRDTTVEGV